MVFTFMVFSRSSFRIIPQLPSFFPISCPTMPKLRRHPAAFQIQLRCGLAQNDGMNMVSRPSPDCILFSLNG